MMKKFLAILLSMGMVLSLAACGSSASSEDVSSEGSNEVVESTEGENTEAVSEIEKEILELSATEYYVDYPLYLEDGRLVYVKKLPNLQFYPEATFGRMEGDRFITCLEQYNAEFNSNFMTALSLDSDNGISEAKAVYYITNNDKLGIDAMKQAQGNFDWTYEFSDPEDYGNGIIVYQMDTIYDGATTTTHFLYYQLDDKYTVEIGVSGFVGSGNLQTSDELNEELLKVLEFYRTEENMFILVDPETMEVVITE